MPMQAGSPAGVTSALAPAAGRPVVDLRLSAYAICLGVAFGLYLLVQGPGRGPAFWACGLGASLALAWGIVRHGQPNSGWLRWGACGAIALALAVPFGLASLQGAPLSGARPLWPQMLVLLFASRVLTEAGNARFGAFWRAPTRIAAPVQIQSGAAALALGGFLALLFYQALSWAGMGRPSGTTLSDVLLGAIGGESAIHRGIVLLFFVILAHLWDSALRHRRDREALRALQVAADAPTRPRDLGAFVAATCRGYGQTRTALLVQGALDEARGQDARAATLAFETFRQASRRFVRGLVTLLPLLGFLGTVVGLATAMGALPLDGAAGARVDLTASLAGLALKFETTMLGLVASMIAGLLLAGLDRSEAEHAAACTIFADTLRTRDEA